MSEMILVILVSVGGGLLEIKATDPFDGTRQECEERAFIINKTHATEMAFCMPKETTSGRPT